MIIFLKPNLLLTFFPMNATFFRTKLKKTKIFLLHIFRFASKLLRENAYVKTVYVKNVCKNISH